MVGFVVEEVVVVDVEEVVDAEVALVEELLAACVVVVTVTFAVVEVVLLLFWPTSFSFKRLAPSVAWTRTRGRRRRQRLHPCQGLCCRRGVILSARSWEKKISYEREISCATGKGGGCRVLFKRSAYQEVARR